MDIMKGKLTGENQKQLSKEFVRQWLIENGFQGKEGDLIPTMSDQKILLKFLSVT